MDQKNEINNSQPEYGSTSEEETSDKTPEEEENQPLSNHQLLLQNQLSLKNQLILQNQLLLNNQTMLQNQILLNNQHIMHNHLLLNNQHLIKDQPVVSDELFNQHLKIANQLMKDLTLTTNAINAHQQVTKKRDPRTSQSKDYKIMTINIKGKKDQGMPENRRKLVTMIVNAEKPAIVFIQEGDIKADKTYLSSQFEFEYDYFNDDGKSDTAIMWNTVEFDGTTIRETKIKKFLEEMKVKCGESGKKIFEKLPERLRMVKLTPDGDTSLTFFVCSWHGPQDPENITKEDVLATLRLFVQTWSEKNKNQPVIIGGDFNLDTSQEKDNEKDPSHGTFSEYKQLQESRERKRSIPYKDNFLLFKNFKEWRVENTQQIDIKNFQNSGVEDLGKHPLHKLLDHDPVVGQLILK